jgi:hypothetical protein
MGFVREVLFSAPFFYERSGVSSMEIVLRHNDSCICQWIMARLNALWVTSKNMQNGFTSSPCDIKKLIHDFY